MWERDKQKESFFVRKNWLMQLWRLRSPMIRCLQAGDWVHLKAWEWWIYDVNFRWTAEEDEMRYPSSVWDKKRGQIFFPSAFVLFRPSMDWIMPIILGRAIYFAESTSPNAKLNQKRLHRHTQKQWLIWTPWLLRLTHKINHHHTNFILPNPGYSWRFRPVPHFSLLNYR